MLKIQPRFPAYIELEHEILRKGQDHPVSAGQSVQNLVLRDKRVISPLTDAVQKALDSLRAIDQNDSLYW